MKNLLKNIVTIILALAVFAGTIFMESNTKVEAVTALEMEVLVVTGEGTRTLESGGIVETEAGKTASILFGTDGIIRLGPSTTLLLSMQTEDGFMFELKEGQMWMNSLSVSSGVNVVAGGTLLMPRRASFDVVFDGNVVKVRAFSNQVDVGLIPGDYVADHIVVSREDDLINSFLIASGGQATVSLVKVTKQADLLRQLLYSKLIKEFQYSLMDPAVLARDSWVSQNLAADKALVNQISSEKLTKITTRGLKYASLDTLGYGLDKAILSLSDTLTFTEEKRTERLIHTIFEHLFDAQYLLAFGRGAEAQERITLFSQLMTQGLLDQGALFQEEVLRRLRSEYATLYTVFSTDPLYDTKVALGDLLIAHLDGSDSAVAEKLNLIRDYMNTAYRLADTHQLEARLALGQYFTRFKAFVESEKKSFAFSPHTLSQENQIMDNLLRQYSQFYQESFFAMKSFLEKEWLKLLVEGSDKDEERQTIISTKIDFLKQLQTFFLDERVSLEDAQLIVFRLIHEIQDLEPRQGAVGVSNLFALRLKDYGNFLKFLKTTNVTQLRSSSPQAAYNRFLSLQREQLSVEEVIREFLGEAVDEPTITVEEILAQIQEDFELLDVTNLRIAEPASVDQDLIEILSAEMDGVVFSGQYDWNRKLLSHVKRGEELLSEVPVRLGSLVLLLKPVEEIVEETPREEVQPTPSVSQAERVAKILFLQKLKKIGIAVEELNIGIQNLDAGEFVIHGATLVDHNDIQIAFLFARKTNQVSSLMVQTPNGDVQAPDVYDLAQIVDISVQLYDQAG